MGKSKIMRRREKIKEHQGYSLSGIIFMLLGGIFMTVGAVMAIGIGGHSDIYGYIDPMSVVLTFVVLAIGLGCFKLEEFLDTKTYYVEIPTKKPEPKPHPISFQEDDMSLMAIIDEIAEEEEKKQKVG